MSLRILDKPNILYGTHIRGIKVDKRSNCPTILYLDLWPIDNKCRDKVTQKDAHVEHHGTNISAFNCNGCYFAQRKNKCKTYFTSCALSIVHIYVKCTHCHIHWCQIHPHLCKLMLVLSMPRIWVKHDLLMKDCTVGCWILIQRILVVHKN